MRFSEIGYNNVKRLVTLILPGIGSVIYLMSLTWTLTIAKAVLGSCSIISFIGGTLMAISTRRYEQRKDKYDGQIVVTEPEDGKQLFTLELNSNPEDLINKGLVVFEVVPFNVEDNKTL